MKDVEAGSKEAEEKKALQEKLGLRAVGDTITTIRSMVKDGRIK